MTVERSPPPQSGREFPEKFAHSTLNPIVVGRVCPERAASILHPRSGALGTDAPYLEVHGEGWGEGKGDAQQPQSHGGVTVLVRYARSKGQIQNCAIDTVVRAADSMFYVSLEFP